MAKTAMIRARVEPDLKHDAEAIFTRLGLSATEAITLFYKQVTLRHGMPFAVRIPNARTGRELQEAYDGKDLIEYENLDALKASLPDD